jgi:CRP-like cAMP-binding protein
MKNTILSHVDLSDDQYQLLLDSGQRKRMPKKQVLFQAGKTNTKLLFIEEGLMRAYRYKDEHEFTHYFFSENWFATDFKSYLTESPSELFIETLTATTYYEFNKADLIKLFSIHPPFEKLGRIIAEKAYLLMVERITDFQLTNLKERYHKLTQNSPQLFQQVPQKYIASYLGVSEQSLSRIKSSVF